MVIVKELIETQYQTQTHDDTLVLWLQEGFLATVHIETYSRNQSDANVTAFLTPPKIIKPHQGKGKAPPTHMPEVGTEWVSFPRTQQMTGENPFT